MIENKYNDTKSNKFLEYLLNLSYNKKCADCGKKDPSWASINFAFFICYECSSLHRSLGPNKSKVKSIQMDSWNTEELRRMYVGGNKNISKLGNNEDFLSKYKDTTKFEKELSKLEEESKIKEPGDSFMEKSSHRSSSHGKANIELKRKQKFSDQISSEDEEIKHETETKTIKDNPTKSSALTDNSEENEEKNLERIEKPTASLKKSVNPSRSPFTFTVKEIEEESKE